MGWRRVDEFKGGAQKILKYICHMRKTRSCPSINCFVPPGGPHWPQNTEINRLIYPINGQFIQFNGYFSKLKLIFNYKTTKRCGFMNYLPKIDQSRWNGHGVQKRPPHPDFRAWSSLHIGETRKLPPTRVWPTPAHPDSGHGMVTFLGSLGPPLALPRLSHEWSFIYFKSTRFFIFSKDIL
jgi:hypothetical protein